MKRIFLLIIVFHVACAAKFDVDEDAVDDVKQDDTAGDTATDVEDEEGSAPDAVDTVDDADDAPSDTAGDWEPECGPDDPCDGSDICCDGECVDPDWNDDHCGECFDDCRGSETCCMGECCEDDACCDDACVDIGSDKDHCGECDNECPGNRECCDGDCVDIGSSWEHCGECFNGCGDSEECCDAWCVDIYSDPLHCGGCDSPCAIGQGCLDRSCQDCVVAMPWKGAAKEYCYLGGDSGDLGKYSYIGRLAPAVDPRDPMPPVQLRPGDYTPNYGFYTIDNLAKGTEDPERDFKVLITQWNAVGEMVDEHEDDYAGRGIIALDAFPFMHDDIAWLVYAGVEFDPDAGGDSFALKKIDMASGAVETIITRSWSDDFRYAGESWFLPRPREFARCLAPADDLASGSAWGLYAGGGLIFDGNQRAYITQLDSGGGEGWNREWMGDGDRWVRAMAFDQGTRKLYALVNTVTDSGQKFATMYCLDANSDVHAACPSEEGVWDTGVPIGITGTNAIGTGLAVTEDNKVVYSWWSPDGLETRIGRLLPSGEQDTGFGEYREVDIYETTLWQDDGVGDCVRRANVSKIIPGPDGSIYIVGYLAAKQEICTHGSDTWGNYARTPTIYRLNRLGDYWGDFGWGGQCDYGVGIYSDAMMLCNGDILVRMYVTHWDASADDHTSEKACLKIIDGNNPDCG